MKKLKFLIEVNRKHPIEVYEMPDGKFRVEGYMGGPFGISGFFDLGGIIEFLIKEKNAQHLSLVDTRNNYFANLTM